MLPVIANERRQYHSDEELNADVEVMVLRAMGDEAIADDAGDNLRVYLQQLRDIVNMQRLNTERIWRSASEQEARRHTKRWVGNVRATTQVDLSALVRDDDLTTMLALNAQQNVGLIRSLSDDVVRRIERLSLGSVLEGRGNRETAKALTEVEGITRRRATLIARDQASKLNGQMTEFRHRQAGVSQYIWRTTMDGRQRDTHSARNTRVYAWDRPPSGGHPGSEINCRCIAQAIIVDDDDLDGLQETAAAEAEGQVAGKGFDPSLLDLVGNTLHSRVHNWTKEAITIRRSELQDARAFIAGIKGAQEAAERELEDVFRRIYGFEAPKTFEAKSMFEAAKSRATMMRKAIAERLAIIEDTLDQAEAYRFAPLPLILIGYFEGEPS